MKSDGFTGRLLEWVIIVLVTPSLISCANSSAIRSSGDFSPKLRELIAHQRSAEHITSNAKNVILFVGDGMGVSTVTATRIFDGQMNGLSGEGNVLSFEMFPNLALVKTYNTNQQVPDSAGTATALVTGVKTRAGVIGVGPEAQRRNCRESLQHQLISIVDIAEERGKATGIVTTAKVTHATPAASYAKSPERDWESDSDLDASSWQEGCRDIAYQLSNFEIGNGIDVVFGGGRSKFFGSDNNGVRRRPSDDLVRVWQEGGANRVFVDSRKSLSAVDEDQQLLGLFAQDHMTYVAERPVDTDEPTLSEMVDKALDVLERNDDGYFLFVEGGRIDHGHHDGKAGFALAEGREFAHTVSQVLDRIDPQETLVMVTADHSHVFGIGGGPTIGNPILGLVFSNDAQGEPKSTPELAADGKPYTTLGYVNGPGAPVIDDRPTPRGGMNEIKQAGIPTVSNNIDGTTTLQETHGGEDVALYAVGPWSHLVRGVLEQEFVFHLMTFAFGWDEDFSDK